MAANYDAKVITQPPQPSRAKGPFSVHQTGYINVDELVPCSALFCCMQSCYFSEDCFGCVYSSDSCCISHNLVACKPSKERDSRCLCHKSECTCGPITTCCDHRLQYCCYDFRCAIPPSEQVPCVFTLCFLTARIDNSYSTVDYS